VTPNTATAATTTAVTAAAAYLGIYLGGACAVHATALATPIAVVEPGAWYVGSRTYVSGGWGVLALTNGSAKSETAPILIGPDRTEDPLVAQIKEFESLTEGWDGYSGARPKPEAIRQAVRFAQMAGDLGTRLEPTLHADGSVILETADRPYASLEFKGDDNIIFAMQGGPVGRAWFDGFAIPSEIRSALSA
jgi:hypothetical protein